MRHWQHEYIHSDICSRTKTTVQTFYEDRILGHFITLNFCVQHFVLAPFSHFITLAIIGTVGSKDIVRSPWSHGLVQMPYHSRVVFVAGLLVVRGEASPVSVHDFRQVSEQNRTQTDTACSNLPHRKQDEHLQRRRCKGTSVYTQQVSR